MPLSERLTLSISPAWSAMDKVAMHDADAALLRHGDGHARFGDGIHGGREQRRIQRDVAGQLGLRAYLGGHHVAVGGDQQHVIKGQGFWQIFRKHNALMRLAGRRFESRYGRRLALL